MFAIGVNGIDLNDPNFRYFDVQMHAQQIKNESFFDMGIIDLVQCTPEHFRQTEHINNNFDTMRGSRKLCPPLNSSMTISGKYASV